MNPHTGAVATFENEADAKAAGHTVPIEPSEEERVRAMSREERKAWAAERGFTNPADIAGAAELLQKFAKIHEHVREAQQEIAEVRACVKSALRAVR